MDAVIDRDSYDALTRFVYLNQASLGLIPRASLDAMTHFLEDVAQHGNAVMSDAVEARALDDLRQAAAALFDMPVSSVAVIGGASEGLGQLAALLATPADEVLLVPTDFPSVTYPWLAARERLGLAVRWVHDRPDTELTVALTEAIRESTSVVCVSAVQYATGTTIDVRRVADRAHAMGARLIVDATQLAGAAPFSMREWDADAVVSSGYKWLSAHGGVALLAVADELLSAIPALVGWKGTDDPFDFDASVLTLAADARRFELSTMAYCSAVGLSRSLALIDRVGLRAIADHSQRLAQELVEAVRSAGWHPFRPLGPPGASSHIISLRNPNVRAAAVAAALAVDHGVIVSSRGDGIRVSLHGYNDGRDIAALAAALETVGAQQT